MLRLLRFMLPLAVLGLLASSAGASHSPNKHANMNILATSPTGKTNSDLAFWGRPSVRGELRGIPDLRVSDPAHPVLLSNVNCDGPQGDVSVWANRILVLSVDQVMTGPECGAARAPGSDVTNPSNWEGLRIFDVSNPTSPRQIASVYQDCGSHTHTMVPDLRGSRLLVYNSSYSLRSGPTCGPVAGPAYGRSPLHGVIQVVEIPHAHPERGA